MTRECLAAAIVAFSPAAAAPEEIDGRAIVAVIDEQPIDADAFARFVLAERERQEPGAAALEQLVQEKLVEREARRRRVTITAADVDARAAQLDAKIRSESQDRLDLERQLAALKVDRAEFRSMLEKAIVAERMMTADFGLPPHQAVPKEKQSLWFQELKGRESVTTERLPEGVAAQVGSETIPRTAWGLKIWKGLPADEADKLFEDFVGIELLLAQGRALRFELTPERIRAEIDERSKLLQEKFRAEGFPSEGVDYPSTLRARGENVEWVVASARFQAEILLKELVRERYGSDGFRRFYDDHRAEFEASFGRRVRVATLFLPSAQLRSSAKGGNATRTWTEASDELEEIKKRLLAAKTPLPESFASQAKLRSEHESATRGGDLGFLSPSEVERRGLPAALFESPAVTLVGPVITADGVHLLLVGATKQAAPFEEIAGEVEKTARREFLKEMRAGKIVERRI